MVSYWPKVIQSGFIIFYICDFYARFQNDIAINEQLKRFTQNPVLVIIEAEPKDLGLPTEAYIEVQEVHDVSFIFTYFPNLYIFLRTVLLPSKLMNMSQVKLVPKKQKKLGLNISSVTSKIKLLELYLSVLPTNLWDFVDFILNCVTFSDTFVKSQKGNFLPITLLSTIFKLVFTFLIWKLILLFIGSSQPSS